MRVIRLSDGRICHLKPGRTERVLPVGQAVALANLSGEPRFGVQLPEHWRSMSEVELRQLVEARMRARLRADAAPAPSAAPSPAPRRGLLSRWLSA